MKRILVLVAVACLYSARSYACAPKPCHDPDDAFFTKTVDDSTSGGQASGGFVSGEVLGLGGDGVFDIILGAIFNVFGGGSSSPPPTTSSSSLARTDDAGANRRGH